MANYRVMETMESGSVECEACFDSLVALYTLLGPMEMFLSSRYGPFWISNLFPAVTSLAMIAICSRTLLAIGA